MATKTTKNSKTASRRKQNDKPDAYQVITDQIVEALESGYVPWHQPWRELDGPTSLSSRKAYRGINVFMLGFTAHARGYASRWWGTYRQIESMGGQVRKGERGTPVVFWRMIGEERDPASGAITKRGVPFLRYFTVFNAEQADDLVVPADGDIIEIDPIEACESIADGYLSREGVSFRNGGNSAYYSPGADTVVVPHIKHFETAEHYYGATFHELAHSTGHSSRLNRKGVAEHSAPFGSPDYSEEELIAEMTAAFVCGEGGIDVNVSHRAGYIKSWLRVFTDADNKKLVVHAAGAAQRAADLIVGPRETTDDGEEG